MPARILIVEDDRLFRAGLRVALERWGYHVVEAGSGEEAQEALREQAFDLLILDLHLPGMSGKELMPRAYKLCPGLKVIVLTGQPDLDSAVLAVRCRAMDYLIKPIDLNDLAGALRRALSEKSGEIPPAAPPTVSLGSMTLDPEAHRLIVSQAGSTEAEIALSPSEALLLEQLMRRAPAVCSYIELAAQALGYQLSNGEARALLRPHICRLRRKLEAGAAVPCRIETVVGKGYRLLMV